MLVSAAPRVVARPALRWGSAGLLFAGAALVGLDRTHGAPGGLVGGAALVAVAAGVAARLPLAFRLAAVVPGAWLVAAHGAISLGWGVVLAVVEPKWNLPPQIWLMLPYVIAILVLAGFVGRTRVPSALGIPYRRASAQA